MITGVVNARYEATIRLSVRDVHGQVQQIEAILDTGFSGSLTLPPATIHSLDLPWHPKFADVFYFSTNSTRRGVHFGLLGRLPSISPSNGHAEIATRQSIRAVSAIYSPASVAAGW